MTRTATNTARSGRTPGAWAVTWTVLLGAFGVGINFTILAVSRPAIALDLHVAAAPLVWLISGPILANALTTATAGRLGDLHGHRRVYLLGIAGSVAFAVLSAVAWNAWSLVAFRVLGAVVGSAAAPASMAMINLMFPPAKRSTALGYWALVGAGGPVVGLIIGGPLVDAFGWRTIFIVQVPLLLGALVLGWWLLPDTPTADHGRFDVAGNVALGVALLALLGGIERGASWGWSNWKFIAAIALSVVAFVVFVTIERRVEHPLIPVKYFQKRSFAVPMIVLLFAQFGYMGGFILAPKLLAEIGHESAGRVSLMLIPRPLAFAIAGVAAGYLVRLQGIRRIALVGTSLIVVSLLMISATTGDINVSLVMASIALSGLGMGAAQPAIATSIANSVSDSDLGVAGASNQMVAQIATSLGMNLLDSVQAGMVATVGLAASYSAAYRLGALLCAGGVAVSFFLPRRLGANEGEAPEHSTLDHTAMSTDSLPMP